ncbi:MAG: HD domain-containing protein, partial [Lachnospiraceae bacterium]|nr:HD domain-containing protein [Lachnospiraceae bacterium]
MLFVKTEDLKQGMRLAKPIYSKTGVLLYGRDTKLTEQGIASIKNFDLIGIYILEPAEPLPPMSDEDVEFERFQAMAVFGIKEDLQALVSRKEPKNLEKMADLIIATYGRGYKKINFTQNLRSPEDYVYKHSLNVAILCALIGRNMNESSNDMRELVMAALIHDVLLLLVDNRIACSNEYNDDDREAVRIAFAEENNMLEMANIPQGIRR